MKEGNEDQSCPLYRKSRYTDIRDTYPRKPHTTCAYVITALALSDGFRRAFP